MLQKNHKGFLLSPVYKYLKGIFAYKRNGKETKLKKISKVQATFFQDKLI